MLKKSVSLIALSLFASSIITACGNSTAVSLSPILDTPSSQQVQSESFMGVYKEIGNTSSLAFKELDKNGDKMITPTEYGVGTDQDFLCHTDQTWLKTE